MNIVLREEKQDKENKENEKEKPFEFHSVKSLETLVKNKKVYSDRKIDYKIISERS